MLSMPENLQEPIILPNALPVLYKRYLRKNPDGEVIESPKEMFWRVASSIAQEESKYKNGNPHQIAAEFYEIMATGKFLPNSPTLMNAGTELGQLCACFVLPVGDSIEEIFDSIKFAAQIHKSGGGTGFSFSRLRPRDSRVGIAGGVASGPVSFMKIFNTATEQIKQGGTRRGANMGILNIDHPDIEEFLKAKEVDGEFNNFNFSVGITETFMQAVEDDAQIALVSPFDQSVSRKVPARDLFNLICEKAWQTGDPGIVFLDRINKDNPTPEEGRIEATNPCGEQPLLPYEACNLGSINLSQFFVPASEDGKREHGIDWLELERVINLAVIFLDNVIDASTYPLPVISEMVHKNRKIGLGVMGFADLLYKLEIPYDSEEALFFADKIMSFINEKAREMSVALARERGPFPSWEQSQLKKQGRLPQRNATLTTIAPTGTLSIIAGCSSGIEPVYALYFTRHIMDNETFEEWNPVFRKELEAATEENLTNLAIQSGKIRDNPEFPEKMRRTFVTAMEIPPAAHLKMQAAFQKHTDNAVSKTVNLPANATVKDVRDIFLTAWKTGCKGVTVYRDGSKKSQVLDAGISQNQGKSLVKKRPDTISGFTRKVQTGLGTLYLTVNEINGQPFEVFATIGKSGRSITAKAEAIGRLVSLALRSGVEVKDIVNQIKGIGGEHPVFRDKGLLLSIPDAIAWVLEKKYLQTSDTASSPGLEENLCPECGAPLIFQEGCVLCQNCGYSKCG